MSFQWEEYLDLARHLVTGPAAPSVLEQSVAGGKATPPATPSEAALRTAVSRAYYSAYHLARTYVVHNRLVVSVDQESHRKVWEALKALGTKQASDVGERGFNLRRLRTHADYEINHPPSSGSRASSPTPEARRRHWKGQADIALKLATSIRDLLAQLP